MLICEAGGWIFRSWPKPRISPELRQGQPYLASSTTQDTQIPLSVHLVKSTQTHFLGMLTQSGSPRRMRNPPVTMYGLGKWMEID